MTAPDDLAALLPWKYPFLLIDRVLDCVPHQRIETMKTISGDDMLALAHRPPGAVFPGAMVLEAMNQSAALLFQLSYGRIDPSRIPLLGFLKAVTPGTAAPGDTVVILVRAIKMTPTHGLFAGSATVDGRIIAEGELAFAVAASHSLRGGGAVAGPDDVKQPGG